MCQEEQVAHVPRQLSPRYAPLRWTAQEALQSRWMKLHEDAIKESAPNSRRKSIAMRTTASLQNFSKYSQFRKIALMVTAAHTGGDSLQATRDMFMKMDTDMNGVISKDELKAAMQEQGLASEELSQLFEGLDMDQSGQIHYMEFLAATLESAGDINEERLKEAFMHMDNDDSGLISFENLKALLGSDATIFTDEDIKAMLLEVSTNGDGKIDFESFCKHVLAPRSQEKVNETLAALSVTQ
jgi:calcium-dependent protein kinase